MTKRVALATCAAVMVFAAVVRAQAPPPVARGEEITVVGCVQPEEIAVQAPGARPVAVKPPAGTPVEVALVVAPEPAATAGSSGTGAAPIGTSGGGGTTARGTGSIKAYRLSGAQEDELGTHVGQRVEIQGRVQASNRTSAADVPLAVDATAMMPVLEIVKFSVVPGNCK